MRENETMVIEEIDPWLWFPPHPTSPPDYPILDLQNKLIYGIPQFIAALIGFPVNTGMLIVATRKWSGLGDTFFYYVLAQLCILNLIQMISHTVAAVITLVADEGPSFSILTIAAGYAACFASDFLRGVIAFHRMILVAFPYSSKNIPVQIYKFILVFDISIFIMILTKFSTPHGAAYFTPRQMMFLFFDGAWIFSLISEQIRITCNYISLIAGGLSYGVISPLLIFHKRKLKKADLAITIQLLVTFCCSIGCFVIWEVILPRADVSTPSSMITINFISQLLWVLQCSQEPGVIFIFNKSLRKEFLEIIFGEKKSTPMKVTLTGDSSASRKSTQTITSVSSCSSPRV